MDCLLVIDIQEEFMKDKSKKDLEEKVKNQAEIIEKFRGREIPVLYTKFPEYGEIIKPIYPVSKSEIIFKNCSDGFFDIHTKRYDTELGRRIKDYKKVAIIGCNADICVKLTIDSAIRLGHEVVVYEDAILSQNSSKRAIQIFKFKYLFNSKVKIVGFNREEE